MRAVKGWVSWPEGRISLQKDLYLDCDGLKIHAVQNCRGSIGGKPAAVLLHGFRSDADELAGLACALAGYGWTTLRLDLRGNGFSEGHPDDVNGYVADTLAGVDYLISRGADRERIFIAGQSLGAAVAITSAAADPRVAGVIALHPGCHYLIGAYYPPIGHFDVRFPLKSVLCLSPRPLLIIAGERDLVLPCSMARELYEAAQEPKRMLQIMDGTHAVEDTEAYALGWLLAGTPHV